VIDPINYDVTELRALVHHREGATPSESRRSKAHGFQWITPPPATRECAQDEPLLRPDQRRRLLLLHDVPFDPAAATPVLDGLPPDNAALVFAWLEYLVALAGTGGTHAALDLYHDTGWLTAPVTETLHEYLAWITPQEGDGLAVLDRTDHLLSFVYLTALAAKQEPRQAAEAEG
jgi:hypothetical protein